MTDAVRDAVTPTVILDARATVAEALARLDQAGAAFIVLQDEYGGLQGPFPAETLRQAEGQVRLGDALTGAPPPIVISSQMDVGQVTRMVAKDLVLNPRLAGVIVREEGRVLGVIPRTLLAQRASRLGTRGAADRMEGSPLDILYFECPVDGERRLVDYYDPQNPPICSHGHRMKPVED